MEMTTAALSEIGNASGLLIFIVLYLIKSQNKRIAFLKDEIKKNIIDSSFEIHRKLELLLSRQEISEKKGNGKNNKK